MAGLLFLYDIVLLVGLAAAASGFVIAYALKRELVLLWVAAFLVMASVDHCALFALEFLAPVLEGGLGVGFDVAYALVPPLLVASERKVASLAFDWPVLPFEWVVIGALGLLFLTDAFVGVPARVLGVLSYCLVAYMLAIWAVSYVRLRAMHGQMEERHYRFLSLLLLVSVSMLVLGNLVQLGSSPRLFSPSVRELGSELFTCVLLGFAYVYLARVFGTTVDPQTVRVDLLDRFAREHDLTTREREVMGMLVDGKSNQEIGNELWLSVGTVKTHAHNIYRKVGVGKRAELVGAFKDYEHTAR